MKLIWLGHASWRIEIGDQILLIDPWLAGNPTFPDDRRAEALDGATAIFVTHGHADHAPEAPNIAREHDLPIYCIADLAGWWSKQGLNCTGFNKGGTVTLGDVKVTMVNATHSSSMDDEATGQPIYTGAEAGYMIEGDEHSIYFSGDTDVMADMKIFADLHRPDIGILAAGGHYTMDMKRAAYAAKSFFDFKTVIPSHYRTFPLLEQDASALKDALPGVDVIEPEVLKAIEI